MLVVVVVVVVGLGAGVGKTLVTATVFEGLVLGPMATTTGVEAISTHEVADVVIFFGDKPHVTDAQVQDSLFFTIP